MAMIHADLCGNFAWISFWVKNLRQTWITASPHEDRGAGDLSTRTGTVADGEVAPARRGLATPFAEDGMLIGADSSCCCT
jgi:hypothetical protein